MLQNLTGWHAIIILAVVLLLFGAAKLPVLAKSVGQSMKIFKSEIRDAKSPAEPAVPSVAITQEPAVTDDLAVTDGLDATPPVLRPVAALDGR